uniref:Uncharacterized protein n=1 Tax=Musca domestica TaxID=7370 RepID=A0A1I8NF18_MUSDO
MELLSSITVSVDILMFQMAPNLYTLKPIDLNNTVIAEREALIFNRLEKVGSQSMMTLIKQLSLVNNFTPYVNKENATVRVLYSYDEEEAIAEEITDVDDAMSYVEHLNWIDFEKFNLPKPIYMNLLLFAERWCQKEPKAYFDTSFNDCVKAGKIPECRFEPDTQVHKDWRQFAMFFCGNQKECNSLNNTVHSGLECVFFNRLEKVGSQSLMTLLRQLSEVNDYTPYVNEEGVPNPVLLPEKLQRDIAEEIAEVGQPMSYVEHINWINFTKFDLPKPIYVNMVRHPIQKVMSAYYYIRHPTVFGYYLKHSGRKMENREWFDTSFNDCVKQAKIPDCIFEPHIDHNQDWRRFSLHLCGNHPDCLNFNSPVATQIAKQNIEREYAVVGSWEDTNITLTVLEHYIPRFFRGATEMYYSDKSGKFKKNATPHNTNLEPEVEAKLKIQFSYEIELYNFCKQRLYKQYIAIKKEELMAKFN